MAQLVQMELPLADHLVSPDGTLGAIFDFRKQKGKVSLGFPMPCSAGAFPRQEPTAKTAQPTLFGRFETKSCPLTHTTTPSLLSQTGGFPPIISMFLHTPSLGSCSPKPFLSLPRHLFKPWTSFKNCKLKFQVGSNIPAITQPPKPLSSLHIYSNRHHTVTKTISPYFTSFAFISTTRL